MTVARRRLRAKKHSFGEALARAFPPPKFLSPASAGIDISDASIKWVALEPYKEKYRISNYGFQPLAEGIVEGGVIRNEPALSDALKKVRAQLGGIAHAHAALPEEAAYVFSMYVPEESARDQILSMIEFELGDRVPIAPRDAVYDFDVISEHDDDRGEEIGIVVFPKELAQSYADVFASAGIDLSSLELEARSIARAISAPQEDRITLSVDFGRSRAGFAVIKKGVPIFTSTVAVGGESLTRTVMKKLSMSENEAELFKNYEGLVARGGIKSAGVESLVGAASALADEVAKHYHYWDTRRNDKGERMSPVSRVLLVGGSSNLKGLDDYIAYRVQAPTERPNVWQNVCSFNDYIPPIDQRTSLQFATAIGLALRGV